ncbi:MAG: hypothetical protein IJ870_02975 [Alphaproteobacteria bacterium]|nr:hypothetical protein [Alphaproteobacteria bacterium]
MNNKNMKRFGKNVVTLSKPLRSRVRLQKDNGRSMVEILPPPPYLPPLNRAKGAKGEDLKGRSMVEMLGVLAVIGVLSAGALAGFNNAMKRHKTNQLISDLETMAEGLSEYKDEFGKQGNGNEGFVLSQYVQQFNLLPQNWKTGGDYLFDFFNNRILFFARYSRISIDYYFNGKKEFCSDLIMGFGKPNSDALYLLRVWRQADKNGENQGNSEVYYGDKVCNDSKICIKDMTATDAAEMCRTCNEGRACILVFDFLPY